MCGIFCSISTTNQEQNQKHETLSDLLSNRGPDSHNKIIHNCLKINKKALFSGHVLWQQGDSLTSQPVQTSRGILLFNGDVFGGKFKSVQNGKSDTEVIKDYLDCYGDVVDVFSCIEGPFSFIYFDKDRDELYFGRDRTGRHSLLCVSGDDEFVVTSVSSCFLSHTVEVPAVGIFCLNLAQYNLQLNPWTNIDTPETQTLLQNFETVLGYKINILKPIKPKNNHSFNIPDFNFETHITGSVNSTNLFNDLLHVENINETVHLLLNLLQQSVRVRVQTTPQRCKNCIKIVEHNCKHSRLGVLFSGGLDCTILALLADKYVEKDVPIDLLNVAFEKVKKNNIVDDKSIWNVPDRVTGLESFEELKRLCPERQWNFVKININRAELKSELQNRICHLVYPLQSVLDESLGAALWFASRGRGKLKDTDEIYESPCRVLLMGMGADELFGGYSKHRNAFKRESWPGLMKILEQDLERIPYRNLGRDNRVISDNGVEGRTPYLDENVLAFTSKLQAYQRCYLNLPVGIGDKLLLRLLAHSLGLFSASKFPKRALQFGSRIADSKQCGNDVSEYLICPSRTNDKTEEPSEETAKTDETDKSESSNQPEEEQKAVVENSAEEKSTDDAAADKKEPEETKWKLSNKTDKEMLTQ
ncbi:asparagine synthetase domain-containing protein CG17486 [Ctenocephalides felis]|uniref:asparagine synthetase domain-containing protein CG17486 n=1 Tax=Ctenocephalides felis TaxID=7515 RepID=UPI000E6E44EE|nr:asparagine synthetase domain-containing protein CG17486 [Ctenocephalides felis]